MSERESTSIDYFFKEKKVEWGFSNYLMFLKPNYSIYIWLLLISLYTWQREKFLSAALDTFDINININ